MAASASHRTSLLSLSILTHQLSSHTRPHHYLRHSSRCIHHSSHRLTAATPALAPEAPAGPQPAVTVHHATPLTDWESRYRALKAERQAAAIDRWQELQEANPDISFPSPDGTDRPSKKVVSIVNKLLSLSVLESYQLAHLMDKTYGFSAASTPAAAPHAGGVAPASAAAAAPAAEEKKPEAAAAKTAFSIRLESFNAADKIKVIKEIRAATGLGLKESKDLVESVPKIVKKDLNKADSDALVKKLTEAGAKVTVE